MKRRWQWLGGVALALVVVVAGAAALVARQVESEMGVETSNAFTEVRELPSPLVEKAAPKIGLASLTGGSFDLSQQDGKLVLVSFWSYF